MAFDISFTFDGGVAGNQVEEEEDMWSSMLSSVASSKRLPAKTILVLGWSKIFRLYCSYEKVDSYLSVLIGGGIEEQKDFVEALGASHNKKTDKKPPLANEFALGYTYLDVLDSDHEGTLQIVTSFNLRIHN